MPKTALLLNVASTLFMTGLVWFVQVVHYPLFAHYRDEAFRLHQDRTGWVVAPVMLVELATTGYLVWLNTRDWLGWTAAILLGLIWLSTAFVQIPQHERLLGGFDVVAYRHLVKWNLPRTLAWTARAGCVLAMVGRKLG